MKKTIFALFSVCLIVISCKKDKVDPVAPVADKPYANFNDGSNWIYEVKTQDPVTLDTITNLDTSHVISGDTTVGSKSYHRVQHNNGSRSYYNITGNDYFQFQNFTIPSIIDTSIEVLYLKDNAAVNTSWSQNLDVTIAPPPFPPVTVVFTSTITETGISKIVSGITYNDVISVTTTVAAPAGITIVSNIKNYYARNIGLIQGNYDIEVTGAGGVHNQTALKFADPH